MKTFKELPFICFYGVMRLSRLSRLSRLTLLALSLLGYLFVNPASAAELANPSTTTNISGVTNSYNLYSIAVPHGATDFRITTSGSNGDADLYIALNRVPTNSDFDYRSWTASSNESITMATPTAGTYHIGIHGYRTYTGVTLYVSYVSPIPPDPNGFLQFLNKSAPRNNELTGSPGSPLREGGVDAGLAYYTAVDPNDLRLTLAAFKTFNNLSDAEVAVYVNDADLGFGRRMYLSEDPSGSVASCVENFAPLLEDDAANVDASAAEKLALAKMGDPADIIATVCMEYSGTPGTGTTAASLKGRKYVKFFSYLGDGARITEAELDGRGNKTQPGLCNICHGGQGNSLVNGVYPLNGDTGAQFLPWDLDTFVYDTEPGYTRADLEPIFKRFNKSVLTTYPQPKTFSFRGDLAIPENVQSTSTMVTSTITVSGVDEPTTNVMVSIDEDAQGGPGLTATKLNDIQIHLVSPDGIRKHLHLLLPRRTTPTGARNLFWSDDAALGREPRPPVNGIITGTILADDQVGLVRNGECKTTTLIGNDLGCTDANGVWTLQIENFQSLTETPRTTGTLKAWSIHFNGMPDAAYIPAPVELVRGWYGGKTLPRATVNSNFVPDGWLDANNPGAAASTSELYLEVIGPTCRACHAQRGTIQYNAIDFSTYDKFMSFVDRTNSLVFAKGLMPLAKRTYENHFWNGPQPEILAEHMPDFVAGQPLLTPGRNIADAGEPRTGNFSIRIGDSVTLNGNGSLFPEGFAWTVTAPDGTAVTLTDPTTATPSFTVSQEGIYQVSLDTSGNTAGGPTTTATTTVEGSANAMGPMSYRQHMLTIVNRWNSPATDSGLIGCTGAQCHQDNTNAPWARADGIPRRTKLPWGTSIDPTMGRNPTAEEIAESYRLVRDRTDTLLPNDSLMITKGLGILDHAGTENDFPVWNESNERHILFKRWVLEGAKNN